MLDDDLKAHVKSQLAAAYSDVEENQIVVKITPIEFEFNSNPAVVYEEIITATAAVASKEVLDRKLGALKFPVTRLTFDGEIVLQTLIRCVQEERTKVTGTNKILFEIEYKHNVRS
jgi:hypothetical protein